MLARDGRYYSGRSDEEKAQVDRATKIIFDIKDGVEMIANVGCSPKEYLDKLPSYMRRNKADIVQARKALDWLTEFEVELQRGRDDAKTEAIADK